jgi:hypothetical protein
VTTGDAPAGFKIRCSTRPKLGAQVQSGKLRLTGARLAMLHRVLALETAVPLLAVAAVAIGTGFGATAMYASLEMQYPMVAPGAACYPPHRGRDPGGLRHHHGHLPAAGTHHRTRGREKRMNLVPCN